MGFKESYFEYGDKVRVVIDAIKHPHLSHVGEVIGVHSNGEYTVRFDDGSDGDFIETDLEMVEINLNPSDT